MADEVLIDNIGEYLRSIREQNKIPLSTVAQHLKIKPEMVQALETNQFDVFPAPAYVKGFLKNYATLLEIDPEPILDSYNRLYLRTQPTAPPPSGASSEGINLKLIITSILGILAIAILGWGIVYSIRFIKEHRTTGPVVVSTKEKRGHPVPVSLPRIRLPESVQFPVEISVEAIKPVFVRTYADGILLFEDILKHKEKKKWKADKDIMIKVGIPSRLNVSINNKYRGILGGNHPAILTIDHSGVRLTRIEK